MGHLPRMMLVFFVLLVARAENNPCSYGYVGKLIASQKVCHICQAGTYQKDNSCLVCPLGKYAHEPGQAACTECPIQTHQNLIAQTTCKSCPTGQVQALKGQVTCRAPTPAEQAQINADNVDLKCPPGTHSSRMITNANPSGEVFCVPCQAGRYSSQTDSTFSCKSCPAGYHSEQKSATCKSDTACVVGQYQFRIHNRVECLFCPPGFFQDEHGHRNCWQCPSGYFQDQSGQGSCEQCAEASHEVDIGRTSCQPKEVQICPLGKFSQDTMGVQICAQCPAGKFNAKAGSSVCADCEQGKFGALDRTTCGPTSECPIGSEKSSDGSCSACAAGRHGVLLPTIGKTVCVACMSGRFQPNTGQTSCSTCAAGSHQLVAGQTTCQTKADVQCELGQFPLFIRERGFCQACPGGKYQPASVEGKQCISCGAGQFQADAGKQSCELCDTATTSGQVECPAEDTGGDLHLSDISCRPGKFVKELGKASLCVVCQAGTFQQFSNKRYCQECPPGKYQRNEGQTSCTTCDEGWYQHMPRQTHCLNSKGVRCPAGQYDNNGFCHYCPKGKFSSEGAAADYGAKCSECAAGHYNNNEGQSNCQPCDAGKYQQQTGRLSCTECARGQYQSSTRGSTCQLCGVRHFQPSTGQLQCLHCPTGYNQWEFGKWTCNDNNIVCGKGKWKNSFHLCNNCPSGKFQAFEGRQSCDICPAGQFSHAEAAEMCDDTSSPTASPTPAPSSRPTTSPTGFPTFNPTPSPSWPPTLAPATAAPTASPTLMPTRFPTDASASPTLAPTPMPPTPLPTGSPTKEPTRYISVRVDNAMHPVDHAIPRPAASEGGGQCRPGEYRSSGACKFCAHGKFSVSTDSATCSSCGPGFYNPFEGASACLACPVGKFQFLAGGYECLEKAEALLKQQDAPRCGTPIAIAHAALSTDRRMRFVAYECEAEWRMVGEARSLCLPNGKWSQPGTCRKQCSHTTCSVLNHHVRVQHSRLEKHGQKHSCAVDVQQDVYKYCSCDCWATFEQQLAGV